MIQSPKNQVIRRLAKVHLGLDNYITFVHNVNVKLTNMHSHGLFTVSFHNNNALI